MRLTALTLSILLGALLLHVVTAGVKMGSCPGAPVRPARCDPSEVRDSCKDDDGCKGRKKCCRTYCGKKCTEPGLVKRGSCPVVYTFAPCKYPLPKMCNFDLCCPGKQKCCEYGCRIQCTEPRAEKRGSCPVVNTFAPCKYPLPKTCDSDSDCLGNKKCCKDGCVIQCTDPVFPPKPGKCPVSPIPFIPCPPVIPKKDRHCTDDWDCGEDQKCCLYVCQYVCKKLKE